MEALGLASSDAQAQVAKHTGSILMMPFVAMGCVLLLVGIFVFAGSKRNGTLLMIMGGGLAVWAGRNVSSTEAAVNASAT